jgi:hypothetical protein
VPPLGTAVAHRLTGPCPDSLRVDADGNVYAAMYDQGPAFAYSTSAAFRSSSATLHRGAPRGEAVQIVNRAKADPAYSAGVANALGLTPLEVTAE